MAWPRSQPDDSSDRGEVEQIPLSLLNTPPYFVFSGPSIDNLLAWRIQPIHGGAVTPDLWTSFKHSCSIFPIKAAKHLYQGHRLSTVHAAAHLLNPRMRAIGAIDARQGAKNSSLAMPVQKSPGMLKGSHPSNVDMDAEGTERIDRILNLFGNDHVMGVKEETLTKAKRGAFDGSEDVIAPDISAGHSLVVAARSSASRVPLYCSYNVESFVLGHIAPPTELIYVGRKSNWVQVIVPQFRGREDSGHRWVDARNLAVGLEDGRLIRLYVNHKSRDLPGTWDGFCHTDNEYVCAS